MTTRDPFSDLTGPLHRRATEALAAVRHANSATLSKAFADLHAVAHEVRAFRLGRTRPSVIARTPHPARGHLFA